MRAGTLRHRVVLERKTGTTQDTNGEHHPVWSTLATLWASVEPVTARESEFAKGFAATVSHTVRLRYRADVGTDDRLRFRGRYLTINGVVNADERRRELVVYATEVVGVEAGAV